MIFLQYLLVEFYSGIGTTDIFFILSFVNIRYILFTSEVTIYLINSFNIYLSAYYWPAARETVTTKSMPS